MADSNKMESPVVGNNGSREPSSKELSAPTKVYPASSKIGHGKTEAGSMIEGPCSEKGAYHK